MTRGKYGKRAANREAAVTDVLGPYQRKVAELGRKLKEEREHYQREVEALRAQVRKVTAERDEGIGPALTVAQREATKMRDERDAAIQRFQDLDKRYSHLGDELVRYAKNAGLTAAEALEWFGYLVEGKAWVLNTLPPGSASNAEMVKAIQRARGERH